MSEGRYRRGDRVRLTIDSTALGRVDGDPVAYDGGWTYPVFFGGNDIRFVHESGLEAAPEDTHVAVLTRDEFLRSLLLAKLDNPLSNFLYAYQASRTQFEPYQFKPVFKYLDAPVQGILIADEVGLGKTIEAAILYQELKARQKINRVLIVCPAGLRVKWQAELLTRFDEQFSLLRKAEILDDIRLYHETDGLQPLYGITGLETIRNREIQDLLDERPVRYDMVIIDEAHHLRTAGRLSNRIGERLSDLTDNLVLLTATPLQTSQQDLFNLLRFIDETQFPQFADFVLQLQPNANLNAAIRSLRDVPPDLRGASEALGAVRRQVAGSQVTAHPNYEPTLRALDGPAIDREGIIRLQRDIDQMNVMSSVYTRTRKRDVTGVAKRQAHVIHVPITEQEQVFYDAVLAHARAQARQKSKTGSVPGWTGMMRERQAASCMTATREYLVELHKNQETKIGIEDSSTDVAPEVDGADGPARQRPEVEVLLEAARALGTTDSKFEVFVEALAQAIAESAGSKVIIFSYFRRTLAYLERQLKARGYDVLQINGDIPPDQRAVAIDQFRTDPKIQILLTSEVGAEGLDFQFCDTLMNYDLPWNPMRVEQRIGRIDRYGQKRDKIRIYSFFLGGTIEERILERLYLRIGIFEDSIGDLEPILGPLANALTREIFAADLSPTEEIEVADRYADLVIRRRVEERDLEARSAELLGQDALILQAIDETVSAGRYISAAELRAIVAGYLADVGLNARLEDGVGDGTATVHADARISSDVQNTVIRERDTRPGTTEFLAKLQKSGRIAVTFDGETAMTSRRLELLNLRHPLVRTAVGHYEGRPQPRTPVVDLVASKDAFDGLSGTFSFGLFLMSIKGAQSQTRLIPVVLDDVGHRAAGLEARLLWTIQEASADASPRAWSAQERDGILQGMTRIAASIADQLEAEAAERNDGILAVRIATVERTIRAKISKRRAQIETATDERIQRMWNAEVRNLEADLRERLRDLESRRAVGVTYAALGAGRITLGDKPTAVEPPETVVFVPEVPVEIPRVPGATAKGPAMALKTGSWVDLGDGRIALITGWDMTSGEARADLPSGSSVERPISFATTRWREVPEEGLLVAAAIDSIRVKRLAEEAPIDVVALALIDLGGRGATQEIRDLITPLVIPEIDWEAWWRRTQIKFDDDDRIDTSKSRDKIYAIARAGSNLGRSLVSATREETRRGRAAADGPQLRRARERALRKGPPDPDDMRLFEVELKLAQDESVDPTDRFMAAELGVWLDRWSAEEAKEFLGKDAFDLDLLRIAQHDSKSRALEWAIDRSLAIDPPSTSFTYRSAAAAGSPWWDRVLEVVGKEGLALRSASFGILGWSVPGDEDAGPPKFKDDLPTFERRIERAEQLVSTLSTDAALGLWEGTVHALRTFPETQSAHSVEVLKVGDRMARLAWTTYAVIDASRRPNLRTLEAMPRDRLAAFARTAPSDVVPQIRNAVVGWYAEDPAANGDSLRVIADVAHEDVLVLGLESVGTVVRKTSLRRIANQLFHETIDQGRTDALASSVVNLAVTTIDDDPTVARALDRLAEAAAEGYLNGSGQQAGPITFSRSGWERFGRLIADRIEDATIREAAATDAAAVAEAQAADMRALAEARAQTLAEARTSAGSESRQDAGRLAANLLKPVALAVGDSFESNSLESLQDRLLAVLQRARIAPIHEVGDEAPFDPSRHQWVGEGAPTDLVQARSPGFVIEGEGGHGVVLVPARVVAASGA